MPIRSWLFVPGDSEKKLAKVASCGADVVIVDLEDAVAPQANTMARGLTREWLTAQRRAAPISLLWVRINALDTPMWRDDFDSVLATAPGSTSSGGAL